MEMLKAEPSEFCDRGPVKAITFLLIDCDNDVSVVTPNTDLPEVHNIFEISFGHYAASSNIDIVLQPNPIFDQTRSNALAASALNGHVP